jgi:hypothetical protein
MCHPGGWLFLSISFIINQRIIGLKYKDLHA